MLAGTLLITACAVGLNTVYGQAITQNALATTAASSSSSSSTASLVTTTALDGSMTPPKHWTPDRPDPYVCEYLGENDCWRPSIVQEGPPYMGFGSSRPSRPKTCTVQPGNNPSKDDAPAIRKAFQDCSKNARIVFENTTYHVASVLNTTGLSNVDIDVQGTLAWNNSDIDYWLKNSLPIGFQNQTSAWHLGGQNVHFFGSGAGTLNGNGQDWYTYSNGRGNVHGRPHAITITESKDMVIEGLRFIKSQMWTMTVARSERILLQDIYVNNSCVPGKGTFAGCNLNTDGCDTLYANNITFLRWTVQNGDDSIALKQNSTNIYIANSTFYKGSGIAVGSIGQYPGQIEVIQNFTATNIRAISTNFGVYLKSWTGLSKGNPPNGGGGGFGHGSNYTFTNFQMEDVSQAWNIDQDQSYNGQRGGQNTSRFRWEDVTFGSARGTTRGNTVVSFQCSGAAPCRGISISDNHFTIANNGSVPSKYACSNVENPRGFKCTDIF